MSIAIPIRIFGVFCHSGFKSICSVPLIARNRIIGTLALNRMTADVWTPEDVEFLAQVAGQVAMTVENSLVSRTGGNEGAARYREALPGR